MDQVSTGFRAGASHAPAHDRHDPMIAHDACYIYPPCTHWMVMKIRSQQFYIKVLALQFCGPDLNAVIGILRCFPYLETLYVIWDERVKAGMKNVCQYDPLNPIKCLESHLKVLVLKNYEGGEEEIDFVKFFVLNAKVVKEIKFALSKKIRIDEKWMTKSTQSTKSGR